MFFEKRKKIFTGLLRCVTGLNPQALEAAQVWPLLTLRPAPPPFSLRCPTHRERPSDSRLRLPLCASTERPTTRRSLLSLVSPPAVNPGPSIQFSHAFPRRAPLHARAYAHVTAARRTWNTRLCVRWNCFFFHRFGFFYNFSCIFILIRAAYTRRCQSLGLQNETRKRDSSRIWMKAMNLNCCGFIILESRVRVLRPSR